MGILAWVVVVLAVIDLALSVYSALKAPFPATSPLGSPTAYRNIYLHIPMAWASLALFTIAFVAALLYVVKGDEKYDRVVQGFAAVGLLFALATLVTGSAWASESWGAAWNWDPRETSVLLLFLAYLVYFVIRASISDPERARMVANIYAIAAYAMVPVVFVAPSLARVSLHPSFETARNFLREPTVLVVFAPKVLTVTLGGVLLALLASAKSVEMERLRLVRYALLALMLVYIAAGVYVAHPWFTASLARIVNAGVDAEGRIHKLVLLTSDGRLLNLTLEEPVESPVKPPLAQVRLQDGSAILKPTIEGHIIDYSALESLHKLVIVNHWSVALSLALTGVLFYIGFEIAARLSARHARGET